MMWWLLFDRSTGAFLLYFSFLTSTYMSACANMHETIFHEGLGLGGGGWGRGRVERREEGEGRGRGEGDTHMYVESFAP